MSLNQLLPAEPQNFDEEDNILTPTVASGSPIYGKLEFSKEAVGFTAPVKDADGNTVTKGFKSPYDPNFHKSKSIIIKMYIDPLLECVVKNTRSLNQEFTKGSMQWDKECLPSILKTKKITSESQLNGAWVKVTPKQSAKTYTVIETNEQGEKVTVTKHNWTWNFDAVYDTEDECRAACVGAGGTSKAPAAPAIDPAAAAAANAAGFLKVVIKSAARASANFDEVKAAVTKKIAEMPLIAAHYKADDPAIDEMIMAEMAK